MAKVVTPRFIQIITKSDMLCALDENGGVWFLTRIEQETCWVKITERRVDHEHSRENG